MQTEVIVALISSVIGGSLVAIVNHLLTRRKYEAETKKLEAEIDKLKAETQKTLAEAEKISGETKHALGEASYYDAIKLNEVVIYDGTHGINGYDVSSDFSEYIVQNGVIAIQKDGASIVLRSYLLGGKVYEYILRDSLGSGYRKFHASCEVKVIRASYEFRIFMMEEPDLEGNSVDDHVVTVTDTEWAKTDFFFRAPPDKNYVVRILAERLSGDGSLQIRNLILKERYS